MMLLRWRASAGEADVMHGPAPVTLRVVPVRAHEQAGTKDYCVGRIPR